MNVMPFIRRLQEAGFTGKTLDRAVAVAGANRQIYLELCQAVSAGMQPNEALQIVERRICEK